MTSAINMPKKPACQTVPKWWHFVAVLAFVLFVVITFHIGHRNAESQAATSQTPLSRISRSTSFPISCYSSDATGHMVASIDGMNFCSAEFFVSNRTSKFGGSDEDFNMIRLSVETNFNRDCQQLFIGDLFSEIWVCYCFEDFCNYPFGFDEFERRGKTLQPLHQNVKLDF